MYNLIILWILRDYIFWYGSFSTEYNLALLSLVQTLFCEGKMDRWTYKPCPYAVVIYMDVIEGVSTQEHSVSYYVSAHLSLANPELP